MTFDAAGSDELKKRQRPRTARSKGRKPERRRAQKKAVTKPITSPVLAREYDDKRESSRLRQESVARSGRDIGEIPAIVNPKRRKRCERSLISFLEEYFPETFYLPWSDDHRKVIKSIEVIALEGGLKAYAMPRGSGKTAIAEGAALWVALYGHHPFIAVIGPDKGHADGRIENMRVDLEQNDRLYEDFPEVCYPLRRLEGITQRRLLYKGKPVAMELTAHRIVLPWIPGSKAAGTVITTAGLTGQIRGMNVKLPNGRVIRPSFAICDDPQTEESAYSPSQCAARESIINKAVLGLAGPGVAPSVIVPCTVICKGDLADRLLDRKTNPQWRGERTRMVVSWPSDKALWEKYAELWRAGEESEAGPDVATEFYRANRDAMDAGAAVSWAERKEPGELSGLQHAMNLKLRRGESAFNSEYQNDPPDESKLGADLMTAEQIAAKVNRFERGRVPIDATELVMFIDVMGDVLFYSMVAWCEGFTGYIVEYGSDPEQSQAHFRVSDVRRTLKSLAPNAGKEAAIYAGLERLVNAKCGRDYIRDDGSPMRVSRCLIDANWGDSTDVVYQFCRQTAHSGVVSPSHGKGIGASSLPIGEWNRKPGDKYGSNWIMPSLDRTKRQVRHVVYDTNFWKSFLQERLVIPMGDPGCLSVFGSEPSKHRMFADHLTAEYRVQTSGRGRTVWEWKLRPNQENHWLDCMVGCCVCGSMRGIQPHGIKQITVKAKRYTYAEVMAQRAKNGRKAE